MTGLNLALVYDLRSEYLALGFSAEAVAEFDSEETIELIAAALVRCGHRVDRIGNGRALARRLANGERFDLVFSIAEGLGGRARESQVPALCELYDQAYVFSDPTTLAVALDKAVAKRIVRDAGVRTAPFAVVADGDSVPPLGFALPAFVKPLAEGTGKGCERASVCADRAAVETAVADLHRRFHQPVIIEPFLPGREFTVGIVDRATGPVVVGVLEIVMNDRSDHAVYSFTDKEECETRVSYLGASDAMAEAAAAVALDAYRALECRDAGRIDIRCDDTGQPCFIEANPLAGLHPHHSDLPMAAASGGMDYDALIDAIVASAARRCGLLRATPRTPTRQQPFVPVLHAAALDRADEADTLATAMHVAGALQGLGYAAEPVRFSPNTDNMAQLARRSPMCVFNLVEAVDGAASGCLLAPWFLARAQLAYTGNGYEAFLTTASKRAAKSLMAQAGIATPACVAMNDTVTQAVILKPEWEHGSLGIDTRSVVNGAELRRHWREREAVHDMRFFAEVFVPGREFNVALIEAPHGVRVLPIQETLFVDWPADRPRIVDFDAKWAPHADAYRNTPRRFGIETDEPALAATLADIARRVWRLFGLAGYARIDFRVDDENRPFVIDVNANPGLGEDAGFAAAAVTAGIDYAAMVAMIVRAADGRNPAQALARTG